MRTIFFEWDDYDEAIKAKKGITLPDGSKVILGVFALDATEGFEAVSIKSFSRISNPDLDALKAGGCKVIAIRIAGFNMLDVDYATEIGLKVYRVAAYSPESIAEYAVALILNLARKMNVQRRQHGAGVCKRSIDSMGFLLKGKTIGLHGYGKIARDLADILRNGFGMKVQFFDPYFKAQGEVGVEDVQFSDLGELYASSDIVSIHVPLNEETKGSVNKDLLGNVRDNFILINTSRGPVVNSEDIKDLLANGKVDYFGTDVWGEDDCVDSDLLTDNIFQSYHVAFFTEEAVEAMIMQTLESLSGNPRSENILPITYG